MRRRDNDMEKDRRFREQAEARNRADRIVHEARKALTGAGDSVDSALRHSLEAAISELAAAAKSADKAVIERKNQAVTEQLGKHAEARTTHGSGAGRNAGSTGSDTRNNNDESVVDAEFEDVSNR